MTSFESELSFTNGAFNQLDNQSAILEYPIHVSNWTVETEQENSSVWGIINTYNKLYDQIKDEYLGGRANPENPELYKEKQTIFVSFFFLIDPAISNIIIYSHGLAVQANSLEKI